MNRIKKERGVAVILALIMLLVMSVLALSISFNSNIDFQIMSNYKQGQEAFLAAERCVEEGRKQFETIGIEVLFFQLQGGNLVGISSSDPNLEPPALASGASCRSGSRYYDSNSGPVPFVEVPPPTKTSGRPLKNVSLPSGGLGGAALVPTSFLVTGKDARDKDPNDTDLDMNTGTEIAVGFETFVPGGASNVY